MKHLKVYIFDNFETLSVVTLATCCSIILLALRLKITESFFLLFLVWNLFLAALPYFISSYLQSRKTINSFSFYSLSIVWLLFIPNAPYIITDFIHLNHKASTSKIFDAIIIASFAISGLLFYMYSFRQMLKLFEKRVIYSLYKFIKLVVPFLIGYGIYLGRFERWNSWNIINDPLLLLRNIIFTLTDPHKTGIIIITTFSYGIILNILFRQFNKISINKSNKEIKNDYL